MDISGVLTAASKGDVASVQDFLEQDGSMANYYGWLVAGKDLVSQCVGRYITFCVSISITFTSEISTSTISPS
jgi:hypothetical protein